MKGSEHLQLSSIVAFREGILSRREYDETSRHLLQCSDCRSLLPLPTPKEIWSCVLVEGEDDSNAESYNLLTHKGLFSQLRSFFLSGFVTPTNQSAIFASVLFLVLSGFMLLLLFNRPSSTENNLVAVASNGPEIPDIENPAGIAWPESDREPHGETGSLPDDPKRGDSSYTSKTSDGMRPLRKENRKSAFRPSSGNKQATEQVETRGSGSPCGGRESIGLETRGAENGIRLIWEKVDGAVSYIVFVSDLDEKLIDQFETSDQTAYTVATVLERDVIYRWKLIVTLKNGERIVGEAQNFRVNNAGAPESRLEISPVRKRATVGIRCFENK
ncbi:MAG TPA: hypothetical protein PKE66_02385 [Pyrinomonadaceae bacterium]|nr:hypothetical protein [Pyrinomonadaceae bacterium]